VGRRYLILLAGTILASLAIVALGRAPRRAPPPIPRSVEAPAIPLTIFIRAGGVDPAMSRVPKGRDVLLAVVNQTAAPARLTLAGYEDRVDVGPIAPGARARSRFRADRPGEDFAWLVDGSPAGMLAVTGSHLEEGHE
jgi:hypothetical protein